MSKLISLLILLFITFIKIIPSPCIESVQLNKQNPLTLNEVIVPTFNYLPLIDIHNVSLVCTRWNNIAKHTKGPFHDWVATKQFHREVNFKLQTEPSLKLCMEIYQQFHLLQEQYLMNYRSLEEFNEYASFLKKKYSKIFNKLPLPERGLIYQQELLIDYGIHFKQFGSWTPVSIFPPENCFLPSESAENDFKMAVSKLDILWTEDPFKKREQISPENISYLEKEYLAYWIYSRVLLGYTNDVISFLSADFDKIDLDTKCEISWRYVLSIVGNGHFDLFQKNIYIVEQWISTFDSPREVNFANFLARKTFNDCLNHIERTNLLKLSMVYFQSYTGSAPDENEMLFHLQDSRKSIKNYQHHSKRYFDHFQPLIEFLDVQITNYTDYIADPEEQIILDSQNQ